MTEHETETAQERLSAPTEDKNRWLALYVLCAGMLMIVLDITIVNVALPSIQDDLGFTQSSLAWVVNAYLIAFGGLLLLSGRFGDILGRKSVFMAGLAVFTVASLLCGVAESQEMLVGARFIQGVGGAMTSAVILGIFGRLKNEWALLPLRVRGIERVRLHADLTILAKVSCALARARAVPLAA